MIENLNWIFLIATLSKKTTSEYTDKDWEVKTKYNLKFDFMWGSYNVIVDKVIFEKLEKWAKYCIEIKPYTNEKMKWIIYLAKQDSTIYESLNGWLLEI